MAGGKSKSKASKKKTNVEATSSAPQPFPYLDGSFLEFGSEEELSCFITHFAKRPISPPRVLPEIYPQQKGYHDLDNQLKESGLWSFVSRSRQSYKPAYVRAFYSNLRRDGDTIRSSINLYDIEIDLATFARVAWLPTRGDDIATYGGDDWILNNEAVVIREQGITNLVRHIGAPTIHSAPPEKRLLLYILTRILRPRDGSHTCLFNEDLKAVHAITHGASINWAKYSESKRGAEGSVAGSVQEIDSRSPSVEEIVEAVEIPLQSEPRNQRRTVLEDSGIRARKCTLTREEFCKAKRLASAPGVTVQRPTAEQSVFDAPPGSFAIHLKSLEYGFRFPLHQLVIDFFLHFDFLPCQVVPKSHRYLAGFLIRCQGTGVRLDLARFLLLFRLAKSSGQANSDSGSYASIFQRQEKLFKTRKDSAKSWKGKFVFVSLSSGSPFRKEPLSSFRRRSAFINSDKMLEDVETLCRGGPFEVGSIVTNDALAALGFVFLSPQETQRSIEEGPSGEIMLSRAERMKLMFPDAASGSSRAPTVAGRPPTPPVKPTPEAAQKKKRKDTASATDTPPGMTPPTDRAKIKDADREALASDMFHEMGSAMMRMVDMAQRLRLSEADRSRAYVEIADLNEALKVAKEQARQAEERAQRAEEQAQQVAEEAARQARQEVREHAVAEFLSSGAFQDEAFARMNDLLKAWGQTEEGKAFARSEGTQWYNLGLFLAQQVLSDRFLNGVDLPEPCDNPDEFDASIYYPNGGDTAAEQANVN
ncbi:unnamed protein product [Cuscuta campestris]|uniref:Uncharacterized protein n=1 Tax=Cuscuta campestris TaxID=132261 RepID=A0A484MZP5_9ASTE|nr:unnamed protein product [Cuscuta campestris]